MRRNSLFRGPDDGRGTLPADLARRSEWAAAHARGEAVPGLVVRVPREFDVAAIRRRLEGPARVSLALLDKNPQVVQELLGEAA